MATGRTRLLPVQFKFRSGIQRRGYNSSRITKDPPWGAEMVVNLLISSVQTRLWLGPGHRHLPNGTNVAQNCVAPAAPIVSPRDLSLASLRSILPLGTAAPGRLQGYVNEATREPVAACSCARPALRWELRPVGRLRDDIFWPSGHFVAVAHYVATFPGCHISSLQPL